MHYCKCVKSYNTNFSWCFNLKLRTNKIHWCTFWCKFPQNFLEHHPGFLTYVISTLMPCGFAVEMITNFDKNFQEKNSIMLFFPCKVTTLIVQCLTTARITGTDITADITASTILMSRMLLIRIHLYCNLPTISDKSWAMNFKNRPHFSDTLHIQQHGTDGMAFHDYKRCTVKNQNHTVLLPTKLLQILWKTRAQIHNVAKCTLKRLEVNTEVSIFLSYNSMPQMQMQ